LLSPGERRAIMAGQTQKERRSSREGPSEVAPPERGSRERGRHLKDKIDELLDEIDGVLEENAEELVRDYVQRGGE
jgi:ubiquitin-like protein Pup